ncbi:MAG: DegT/DnrJ/EryC1/StrS family aminotransferase [Chloroflexota bacterium]|nr:DegT/DnrJ/EryC1/StrS family aminotransferase [Chloroflexota bacterium]
MTAPTAASTAAARPIPFFLTKPQYLALKAEIDAAIRDVLDTSFFTLGKQVEAFEQEFAAYLGEGPTPGAAAPGPASATGASTPGTWQGHVVGVGSGTDALHLALWALGIGAGDDVLTVSHTAVATAAAIESSGARPVFVDVDPVSFTLDPTRLESALTTSAKAIVPVHLYGHPADMGPIQEFATRHGLAVVEDVAQAHGAGFGGRRCGTLGDMAAFSFYPTKNVGAYGDGGAVVTADPDLAERVRLLRQYGWSPEVRYVSQTRGTNSRLDELQAAILRVKLRHLDQGNERRRRLADVYRQELGGVAEITLPAELPWGHHVYHLFVVRASERDRLRAQLQEQGISTQIHYPLPVHRQPAYSDLGYGEGSLTETERASREIVSLPLYPELPAGDVQRVAAAIRAFYQA